MQNPALPWSSLAPYMDRALELAPAERDTWLSELTTSDPQIAAAVRGLLARHALLDGEGFLARSPVSPINVARAGKRVGAYMIDSLIGRGGMGEVWLASRTDGLYQGKCAIKFLDAAAASPKVAERFRREGNVLAKLKHPNIARLFDAGATDDGSPYLVLEYLDGERIDQYCERQALSIRARVELFLGVVAAVAHAHSQLVIHRDLKPSNVLVTKDGHVKLLDFGIAKLLTADPDGDGQTRVEDIALTPEYAAPEQILGEAPGTATDVYQLGMLLHVVLTGQHPHAHGGSRAERMRAALEGVTPPASEVAAPAVRKSLRGDLDAIIAKALRKDPAERYASASALHDELLRYLQHEPVQARRGAAWYRVRKFFARHRAAASIGAAAVVGLVAALAFALVQMRAAEQQRDAARVEQQRADAESGFLNSMISQLGEPNDPITPAKVLEKGLDTITADAKSNPEVAVEVLIQMSGRFMDMGEHKRELDALVRAEALARTLPNSLALAKVQCNTVETEVVLGNMDAAAARLAEGQRALARAVGAKIEDELTCVDAQASVDQAKGRLREAIAALERSVALREKNGLTRKITYPPLLNRLAGLYASLGEVQKEYEYDHRARLSHEQAGRKGTINWSAAMHNEALSLFDNGRWRGAFEAETPVVNAHRAASGDAGIPSGISAFYATLLSRLARPQEALLWYERALTDAIKSGDENRIAQVHASRARTLLTLGREADALAEMHTVDTLTLNKPGYLQTVAGRVLLDRAGIDLAHGALADAHQKAARVIAQARDPDGGLVPYLDDALLVSARIEAARGNLDEAQKQAREALTINEQRTPGSSESSADVGISALQLAEIDRDRKELDEARRLVVHALAALRTGAGAEHPLTRRAVELEAALGH